MWRFRIQSSRAFAALLIPCLSAVMSLTSSRLEAQTCTGTLGSITYSTMFTSTDGSDVYTWSVPQFPVSTLTLYAVTVRSVLTLNSGMTIENFNNSNTNSSLRYTRDDQFTSSPTGDFENTALSSTYGPISLPPFGTATFPPVNSFNNKNLLVDTMFTGDGSFNPSNGFLGNGNIDITYNSGTYTTTTSGVAVISSTFADTMRFSWTYYYCNPGTLAADLLSFTAVRQGQTVMLGWNTTNEEAGRKYNIQVSTDGATFSDYAAVASEPVNTDASYSYNYPIDPSATGKLYFRLRIADVVGADHYSSICIINLNAAGPNGFTIFPNPPTDFINLTLPGDNRSWQVDIIAADGNLIQRNIFTNTNLAHVNFNRKLSTGAYFVRATNGLNGESHTGSFVISQ